MYYSCTDDMLASVTAHTQRYIVGRCGDVPRMRGPLEHSASSSVRSHDVRSPCALSLQCEFFDWARRRRPTIDVQTYSGTIDILRDKNSEQVKRAQQV